MRRYFIVIGVLLLAAGALWFLFAMGREEGTPAGPEAVATNDPFGMGPDVAQEGIPATEPTFEGEALPLPIAQVEVVKEGVKLFKLEASPVAGFIILTSGTTTVVRYADRATGNIFDVRLPTLEKKRLTNNTLPQIYEAYFRDDGAAALFRALDENDVVKNMALALTPPKATSTDALYTVSMTLLRGQMDSIARGAGDIISYVAKDANAVASSKFNGEGVATLWSGPFTSWRTGRLGAGTLVFTKPAATLPGYAYRVSAGTLTKLLGPLNGLIAMANPLGTHLIYSYTEGASTRLFAKEVGKSASTEFTPSTLADKCVGSVQEKGIFYCGAPAQGVGGTQPDAWYQGKAHFSDSLWRFEAATGAASLALEPEGDFGVALDVSAPQLSPDGKYFVFINKSDLSLWGAKLK